MRTPFFLILALEFGCGRSLPYVPSAEVMPEIPEPAGACYQLPGIDLRPKPKPTWRGFVLVRTWRARVGFFLTQRDPFVQEEIVSSEDPLVEVNALNKTAATQRYEVPTVFGSPLKEIQVRQRSVTGIYRFANCTFPVTGRALPWKTEGNELEGLLFHVPMLTQPPDGMCAAKAASVKAMKRARH